MSQGEALYAWQMEEQPDVWAIIGAWVDMVNAVVPLVHRNEQVAKELFGPIANGDGEAKSKPIRLARFELAEVLEAHLPGGKAI